VRDASYKGAWCLDI